MNGPSSRRAHAVVLLAMAGSAEDEAPRLAGELGCTLYEARLRLVAPKPLVVLQTDDGARAERLVQSLGARQHAAVAIDTRTVPTSESMVEMDHFLLTPTTIELRAGGIDPLGYEDVMALLPAVHRVALAEEPGSSLRPQPKKRFAALTGQAGPRGSSATREERTQVVYIYRRRGRPWLLKESAQTSGPALGIGRFQSFRVVSGLLRSNCTRAAWDERLLHAKVPEEPVSSSSAYLLSNVRSTDLLAYALSSWISLRRDNPYRM